MRWLMCFSQKIYDRLLQVSRSSDMCRSPQVTGLIVRLQKEIGHVGNNLARSLIDNWTIVGAQKGPRDQTPTLTTSLVSICF